MSRSPLEQLASLSANRSEPVKTPAQSSVAELVEQTPASDIAFARLSSAIEHAVVPNTPIFDGVAISKRHFGQFWQWFQRDFELELVEKINHAIGGDKPLGERDFELQLRKIVDLVEDKLSSVEDDERLLHRLTIQIGGQETFYALPTILILFQYLSFVKSAIFFAQELNTASDAETFTYAFEQLKFPANTAKKLWCFAFVQETVSVELMVDAIAPAISDKSEEDIRNSGYGEYIDALLVDAQNRIELIEQQSGVFRDVDLICRCIDRFHQITRCLQLKLDLPKATSWILQLEQLIKRVAEVLNGRFKDVLNDMSKVLRPSEEALKTRLDPNEVLQAYNGLYILAATRTARESLALNVVVERCWREVGRSLELMVDRIFEHYKHVAGTDPFAAAQVDIAIKFSSVRFGEEYAAVLTQNKTRIEQRVLRQQSQAN